MNDARALLDSLMGQTRNQVSAREKRKGDRGKHGDSFKDDGVCKLWLSGFCPEHEELFYNTKRDLGPCPKTHYEMHMEEFNAHPDKERWRAACDEQLLGHLGRILRETRDITAREQNKYEQRRGPTSSVDGYRGELPKASKLLAEAEELAEKGDFDGSKRKIAEAKASEEKAKEWEDNNSRPVHVSEKICDICGERKSTMEKSAFKHEAGRVHQGILLIQSKHAELKKKEEEGKLKVDKDIIKEQEDRREREAKERRRAKEREKQEREERECEAKRKEERESERRRREHAELKKKEEEEEKLKLLNQEIIKEKEDRREREAKERRRAKEREKQEREEREREAKRKEEEREAERRRREGQGEREPARPSSRRSRSRSRGRRCDRANHRAAPEGGQKEKEPPALAESQQNRQKARIIEKEFMNFLVHARLSPESSYKEIEARLCQNEPWAACPEQSRRELTAAFLEAIKEPPALAESQQNRLKARIIEKKFMDLLVHARLSPESSYKEIEARLCQNELWAACPEQSRRELTAAFLEAIKEI